MEKIDKDFTSETHGESFHSCFCPCAILHPPYSHLRFCFPKFLHQVLSSEHKRLREIIKSKNINGVHFLDSQVEALLKILEE